MQNLNKNYLIDSEEKQDLFHSPKSDFHLLPHLKEQLKQKSIHFG